MDSSATPEPQPAAREPRPPLQFTLRTLLLMFVVLGSSLAVFGGWGIVVFGLVMGLAIYIRQARSFNPPGFLTLGLTFLCLNIVTVRLSPYSKRAVP